MERAFEIKDNAACLSVNPKVYPLDVVYAASYVFIDKAYVILDGDPHNEILVELRLKGEGDLEKLGYEFYNELLNYAMYKTRSAQNQNVREAIIKRALLTAEDDPEGITKPVEVQDAQH